MVKGVAMYVLNYQKDENSFSRWYMELAVFLIALKHHIFERPDSNFNSAHDKNQITILFHYQNTK